MTAQEIMDLVVANVSDGERVDYKLIREVNELLRGVQKSAREANKAFEKEQNEIAKAEKAVKGKEFCDTLKEGDEISYTMADGTVVNGTFGGAKEKTAHIILAEIPAGAKTADRYVSYDKIVC